MSRQRLRYRPAQVGLWVIELGLSAGILFAAATASVSGRPGRWRNLVLLAAAVLALAFLRFAGGVCRRRLDARNEASEQAERVSLEDLDPAFLLPLTFDRTPSVEAAPSAPQPQSAEEIRFVQTIAAQTGLALENSHLIGQIAAEIAEREKQKRELEIAREVQQRLFPQEHPPVAGLEYAGACRPALEVGGDYYDFIKISDREFGIAIGDVSGKGIPASLLMATLRAFLRGQAPIQDGHLNALMSNLNRFVYDSSPSSRYATFFYAQHDAARQTLAYVNGGHNPPLLFKASAREPVRLEASGPVIGLLPVCAYAQQQVELHPGDIFVAFTDGISEAMNSADEDWGEERLIATVQNHRNMPLDALIARIIESADAFAAGHPQHDDMTVVLLRAV